MTKAAVLLCLVAGALPSARAQVAVEVLLDQDQFLPGEPVKAAVRLVNRSGETLHLGQTQDWLAVSVEGRDGLVVEKLEDVPVVGAFTLRSSQMATKRLDLAPYFDLTQPGRYAITATVRIDAWGAEFTSPRKSFDVIKAVKLWEQDFGVPRTGPGEPEVRKYALQQARYLKDLQLYVRVSNATDAKVFRVFALGPMVSFGQPEPQVDARSNLHVLFQTGARSFLYCVVSPSGELLKRQLHDYTDTRPHLALNDAREIVVTGGVRRETANDIPVPAQFAALTNDVPKLKQ